MTVFAYGIKHAYELFLQKDFNKHYLDYFMLWLNYPYSTDAKHNLCKL